MCIFAGKTLRDNLDNWKQIEAPDRVIDWIRYGVPIETDSVIDEQCVPGIRQHKWNRKEFNFIRSEVSELLYAGILDKCCGPPKVISPISTVPKKGGDKFRLITDLRFVNSRCTVDKFSNEDIRKVIDIIEPGDYLVTVDLKQGFFHVPVLEKHQDLLGFRFNGNYYKWKSLPFGYKGSPYYFNKILRPVVRFLRSKGLRVSLYVDDFILCASKDDIEDHKQLLLDTLSKLGLHVNWEKSSLTASQVVEYLGFIIRTDGKWPSIEIPPARIKRVKKDIARTVGGEYVNARVLARILGQCVSMTRAIIPGKLLLRNAYRLLSTKQSWSDGLFIDEHTRRDLNWWLTSLENWNGCPIKKLAIDTQLVTDASGFAWGAHMDQKEAFGLWDQEVSQKSSNYREMLAVLMGLHSFASLIGGKYVQVLTDNISTVAYLNKLGGPSRELSEMATTIWVLAHELKVELTVSHIRGIHNVRADQLSRVKSSHEWELHPKMFKFVDSIWGPHTIDRFATWINHKVEVYNSWGYDPRTSGVDALGQADWGCHNNYVNPPFGVINKVLNVIEKQRAVATLIAPWWPAQSWFQRLQSMALCPPVALGKTYNIVIPQSEVTPEPLKNRGWRMYAWRLSGLKGYPMKGGRRERQNNSGSVGLQVL